MIPTLLHTAFDWSVTVRSWLYFRGWFRSVVSPQKYEELSRWLHQNGIPHIYDAAVNTGLCDTAQLIDLTEDELVDLSNVMELNWFSRRGFKRAVKTLQSRLRQEVRNVLYCFMTTSRIQRIMITFVFEVLACTQSLWVRKVQKASLTLRWHGTGCHNVFSYIQAISSAQKHALKWIVLTESTSTRVKASTSHESLERVLLQSTQRQNNSSSFKTRQFCRHEASALYFGKKSYLKIQMNF